MNDPTVFCYKAGNQIRKMNASVQASGASYTVVSESGEQDAAVEQQIRNRYDAKKAKDFARADAIRDALKAQGIEVTDVPGGAKWRRA